MEKATASNGINYKPKFGRVIIKRDVKQKTTGGIIIPDTAAKRIAPCEGEIVALGETAGWVDVPQGGERVSVQTMKVGDRVIFGRHSGVWLDATYKGDNDDGTLFACQDADIIAVIEQEAA